jgi:prepilin-type N-terminal cleavage/methylation domain-containing protein
MRPRATRLGRGGDAFGRARRARAGFTLIELMIAMIAGLGTVMAAYYLGSVSARGLNRQVRITETQTAVRAAMEQLQRDIPRAGFLATADSNRVPDCGVANSQLTPGIVTGDRLLGVSVTPNGSITASSVVSAALQPSGVPSGLTRADSLVLLGNFETSDIYKLSSASSSTTLIFEANREGFRRSFVSVVQGVENFDTTRFQQVFAIGKLVRIDLNNYVFFRAVNSVNADPLYPSITLSSAIPTLCFRNVDKGLVAPLSMIRYQIESLSGNAAFTRVAVDSGKPGSGSRVALVRSELNPSDGTVIEGTPRMVLDYAVEFAVDGSAPGTTANTWASVTPTTTIPIDSVNDVWQLRSLRVTLSARSEDVDLTNAGPDYRATSTSPLTSFPVITFGTQLGRARVRSLRQDIALPNMRF